MLIFRDDDDFRSLSMTYFNKSEAERLAKDALPELRKEADSDALSAYVLMTLSRTVTESPRARGRLRLTRKAADGKEPLAMGRMALLYEEGRGIEKDPKAALEWRRKAAEAGYTVSMIDLLVPVRGG